MSSKITCPRCGLVMDSVEEQPKEGASCTRCGRPIASLPGGTDAASCDKSCAAPGCGYWASLAGVLLFVVLVVALVLPAITAKHSISPESACRFNLHMLGLALQNYHDEYGRFPPPYTVDKDGNRLHSWRTLILPYVEERAMYERIQLDEPWNSAHNRQFASTAMNAFRCPKRRASNIEENLWTDYVMITGPGTVGEGPDGVRLSDITDGPENTMLLAEVVNTEINRMEPRDYDIETMPHTFVQPSTKEDRRPGLGSHHISRVAVLMADGTVKRLDYDTDAATLEALMTIAGGEPNPSP